MFGSSQIKVKFYAVIINTVKSTMETLCFFFSADVIDKNALHFIQLYFC